MNIASDRVIPLGSGLAAIPERLLLAHARGKVLFIAGAGISQPANLPDFRGLVLRVYAQLDAAVHAVIATVPPTDCNHSSTDLLGLTNQQAAEVMRFIRGDYDVVLGMLERRIDGHSNSKSRVRQAVAIDLFSIASKRGNGQGRLSQQSSNSSRRDSRLSHFRIRIRFCENYQRDRKRLRTFSRHD